MSEIAFRNSITKILFVINKIQNCYRIFHDNNKVYLQDLEIYVIIYKEINLEALAAKKIHVQ